MRVALWKSEVAAELVEALRKRGIKIVVVLGGQDDAIASHSEFDLFFGNGFERVDMASAPPLRLVDGFLDEYARCAGRIGFNPITRENNFRSGGIVHPDSVNDWVQFHAQIARSILSEFRPDQLWMANHPHMGFDNVLVEVALREGIEVLQCSPLPIPEKFRFRKRTPAGPDRVSIEQPFSRKALAGFKPDLFYLRAVQRDARESGVRTRARLVRTASRQRSVRSLLAAWYESAVRRRKVLTPSLLELLDRRQRDAVFTRFQRRFTARGLRRKCRRMTDWRHLERPFIYFPLHLEPEAAVSGVGHGFHNQVNAIQALRWAAPPDWSILLKENPKQAHLHRDRAFYARLAGMSRVAFAADDADSAELIDAAALVATVNGTAGYEALRAGKPCVFFGDPWYGPLPGAHAFDSELDLRELAGTTVDQQAVDDALDDLSERFADGFVNRWMAEILPEETDWRALMETTADSLVRIARA
jgi:hypothetical protein